MEHLLWYSHTKSLWFLAKIMDLLNMRKSMNFVRSYFYLSSHICGNSLGEWKFATNAKFLAQYLQNGAS